MSGAPAPRLGRGLDGLVQVGWAYRRFQAAVTRQLGDVLRGRRVAIYGAGLSGELLGTTLQALGATVATVVDGSADRQGANVCGLTVHPVATLASASGIDAVVIAASLPSTSDAMRETLRAMFGARMSVYALTDLRYDGDGVSVPGESWPTADPASLAPWPLPSDLHWMRAVSRRHPLPVRCLVRVAGSAGAARRRTVASVRAQWHRCWTAEDAEGTPLACGRLEGDADVRVRVECPAGVVLPPWALQEWGTEAMLWPADRSSTVQVPQDERPPAVVRVSVERGRPRGGRPHGDGVLSFGGVHAPRARWPRVAGRRALPVVFSRAPLVLVDPGSIRRIVVIKLDHVGDVVLSVPVIASVRARFPRAEITVVTASWTTPLLEDVLRAPGVVDRVVTLDVFHEVSGQGRRPAETALGSRLRQLLGAKPFDLAIDLRRLGDARDVLQAVDARLKVAFGDEDAFAQIGLPSYGMKSRAHVPFHTVDQLQLLVDTALGPQSLDVSAALPAAAGRRRVLPAALHRRRWIVALAPGSGDQLRMWPAEAYAGLASRVIRELGAGVALVGSAAEAPLMARVVAAAPPTSHLVTMAGRLSLTEFRSAVREAHLFVGNTTGPTHIAASSGVPTLNVFSGQVSPLEWAPRGPDAFVLWTRPSCAPCYLPAGACPFHRVCLTSITPDHAFEAVRRILLARYGTLRRGPRQS